MRITKAIREKTTKEIIKNKYAKKEAALKKEIQTFLQQAAENRHPPETRKWIEKAPPNALQYLSSIAINERYSLGREWADAFSRLPKPVPVLANENYSIRLNLSDEDIKTMAKLKAKVAALQNQKEKDTEKLATALASCNTYKQLQEKYPELAEYINLPSSSITALAIPRAEIKKVLADVSSEKT